MKNLLNTAHTKWKSLSLKTKKVVIFSVVFLLLIISFVGIWGLLINSLKVLITGGIIVLIILGIMSLFNLIKKKNNKTPKSTKKSKDGTFHKEYNQDPIEKEK